MLLALALALHFGLQSPVANAQASGTTFSSGAADHSSPPAGPAPPPAAEPTVTSSPSQAKPTVPAKVRRSRRRKRKHRAKAASNSSTNSTAAGAGPGANQKAIPSGVAKHLPAYNGKTKTATEPLEPANSSPNSDPFSENDIDATQVPVPAPSANAPALSGAAASAPPGSTALSHEEAPRGSDVSAADLAPGPVIQYGKVERLPVGDEGPTLDQNTPGLLRFGLLGGSSLTHYQQLQSGEKEGALLLGAVIGLATDWWESRSLFGQALSGEENLRLDEISSFDVGAAQMLQIRLDSVLFLGDEAPGSITPLVGLGLGWSSAELKTPAGTTSTHILAQGVVIAPSLGARWRFAPHLALDLKAEPLFYSNTKLSRFGELNGVLGLLLLF